MQFRLGIQDGSACKSVTAIPAAFSAYLLPDADKQFLQGSFGSLLSQSICTPEIDYKLHHFCLNENNKRVFALVSQHVLSLLGVLRGTLRITDHTGSSMDMDPGGMRLCCLQAGREMVVDLGESHVTLVQLNFNAPFIDRHLHQYPGLEDVTRDLGLAGTTMDINVAQDHVSRHAWQQLPLALQSGSMPHAIIAEQGRALLRLYAERLIVETVHCKAATSPGIAAKEEAMAARVRKLIEVDLRVHHSLEALAQLTGWNISGIKEMFPKVYGRTPYQHLLHCRMEFAKDRVLSTRDPIKVIAIDCGYRQEHHFIKRFRETYGTTPGAMRKVRTGIENSGAKNKAARVQ